MNRHLIFLTQYFFHKNLNLNLNFLFKLRRITPLISAGQNKNQILNFPLKNWIKLIQLRKVFVETRNTLPATCL